MAGRRLRRPSSAGLHEAFLWSEMRRVTKTASVSLFGNHYELDPALVGARVQLLFNPFDLTDIQVRYQDRPMGRAVPRRIGRHAHPAARPEAAPPPRPSGIDYLGLVADCVSAEERSHNGIAYANLGAHAGGVATTDEEGGAYEPLTESGVQQLIRNLASAARIKRRVYPHLLRHSYITWAIRRGMHPVQIRQIVGHESTAMIDLVYTRLCRKVPTPRR